MSTPQHQPVPLLSVTPVLVPLLQNQFDSIDLSDNAIVRLEGFPRLPRLRMLLLSNNRIAKVSRNLEGEQAEVPGQRQRSTSAAGVPRQQYSCHVSRNPEREQTEVPGQQRSKGYLQHVSSGA
eukprot:GHUV01020124.1.p1 GENE.GHUV01020124.1~~GHUV01020124.1.p1  ORF type:complete len:123 (+),score=33.11 GHUV01020124.1:1110-1478(+)